VYPEFFLFSDHFGNPFEYEPAPLLVRGMAYMRDNFLLAFFWILLVLLIIYLADVLPFDAISGYFSYLAIKIASNSILNKFIEVFVTVFIVIMIFFIYILVFLPMALVEYLLKGRSIAKILFGIRTMSSNGEFPGLGQVIIRTLIRGVEVNSLIVLIFIIATPRRQTFYDVLAGTVVISDYTKKTATGTGQVKYVQPAKGFRLYTSDYDDVLLWQRYFLMLFISDQPSPVVRNYHCQLALKRLLDAAPSAGQYFTITGKNEDGLENEEMLWTFSRALDHGEVIWENR
jgi:uncharacterized RDD family membrane protein YckC